MQAFLPLSSSREIRANYWQKWFVHRTIRPEAVGGLVHNHWVNGFETPLHDDVLASEAVDRSYGELGTYFLSGAYPGEKYIFGAPQLAKRFTISIRPGP